MLGVSRLESVGDLSKAIHAGWMARAFEPGLLLMVVAHASRSLIVVPHSKREVRNEPPAYDLRRRRALASHRWSRPAGRVVRLFGACKM